MEFFPGAFQAVNPHIYRSVREVILTHFIEIGYGIPNRLGEFSLSFEKDVFIAHDECEEALLPTVVEASNKGILAGVQDTSFIALEELSNPKRLESTIEDSKVTPRHVATTRTRALPGRRVATNFSTRTILGRVVAISGSKDQCFFR